MRLTPHFTLEEFTYSETATRLGIDNSPTIEVRQNLQVLALGMENVRELLGKPIHISSGYRCYELNDLLKSKRTSAHTRGLACDFRSDGFGDPNRIVFAIYNSEINYDQLILEYWNPDNPHNGWVHIAFAEVGETPRRQTLIIDKQGTRLYNP